MAEPALASGQWDLKWEDLLYVAPRAYEQATGEDCDHVSPVDYESGAGWPEDAPVPLGHGPWRELGPTGSEWMLVAGGVAAGGP